MKQARYTSLDIFRGSTVALMILVNNPGTWAHIYSPLEHAEWHGCTPTDLVFPFFLFAVGNALAFVMPKFEAGGTALFLRKVFRRTLLIFAIGLFLNWSPFIRWDNGHLVFKDWQHVRIMGVLQRIALCYGLAALAIYFLKVRGAFYAGCVVLLFYWFICWWLGQPGDPYSLAGWFGTKYDLAILGQGHIYHGEGVAFDPEGLFSLAPAIVQVILGYLVGLFIREASVRKHTEGGEPEPLDAYSAAAHTHAMLNRLFISACGLCFAGYVWDWVFPVNKKIWTSSYVLYTTGLATLILSLLIYQVEVRGREGWLSRFFLVFGKNPLFIFFLSGFLPRLLALIRIPAGTNPNGKAVFTSPFGWFYEHICKPVSTDLRNGSLLYAVIMILFYWSIVYWLDRRKIYIRV